MIGVSLAPINVQLVSTYLPNKHNAWYHESMNKMRAVDESPYGLYVWKYQGSIVADEDGNMMNIPARKGDLKAMSALRKAAAYFGVADGEPVFLSGRRRVTESEFEDQQERQLSGLIADPYDWASVRDDLLGGNK
jgi:hypothetical protein